MRNELPRSVTCRRANHTNHNHGSARIDSARLDSTPETPGPLIGLMDGVTRADRLAWRRRRAEDPLRGFGDWTKKQMQRTTREPHHATLSGLGGKPHR